MFARLRSHPSLSKQANLAALIIILLPAFAFVYNRSRAPASFHLEKLPEASLSGVKRLLVVAPHPDDETLGPGGLIEVAHKQGVEVRVVVTTNGDGQRFAPLALERRVRPKPGDYVILGERRQTETLSALNLLGVAADKVYFLGYPDGSLNPLWMGDWNKGCPLMARFTHAIRSEYPDTYNPAASYCGRDVLADISAILKSYQPDLVLLPHPDDEHPDHRATANFTWLALLEQTAAEPDYRPAVWGYLVHYGYFPQPRGRRLDRNLVPPIPLTTKDDRWVRLDLDMDQVRNKYLALQRYKTQTRLMGSFLYSFARRNEIFLVLDPLHLSPVDFDSVELLDSSGEEAVSVSEPAKESSRRVLVGGADLVGLKIARLGNLLYLTAESRGRLLHGLHYRILFKFPDGDTQIVDSSSPDMALGENSFSTHIDLHAAGDPAILAVAAEVREGVTLDRTGWSFLILNDWMQK